MIAGFELTGVNQVWVSDKPHRIGERFYYLTFIMDLFSRRIVGYAVSDNLMTEHPRCRQYGGDRVAGPHLV
ncbi:MAG: hypothetical protein IPN69_07515 [Acidobacteria bacterium]|nr:hypothetical protein [Acidobacteriota bacterium]